MVARIAFPPKQPSDNLRADPAAEWAQKICAQWRKGAEAFIEAGRLLIASKADLKSSGGGSWEAMMKERLPFSPRIAQMLMKIADHPVISDPKHVSLLPPSWGTLYQIARLPAPVVEKAIADGRITPKTERKDVAALKPPKPPEPSTPEAIIGKPPTKKLARAALPSPEPQPARDHFDLDEEIELLREFARFVIERTKVTYESSDYSEWKLLLARVKGMLK
jgi:hypothetical protein